MRIEHADRPRVRTICELNVGGREGGLRALQWGTAPAIRTVGLHVSWRTKICGRHHHKGAPELSPAMKRAVLRAAMFVSYPEKWRSPYPHVPLMQVIVTQAVMCSSRFGTCTVMMFCYLRGRVGKSILLTHLPEASLGGSSCSMFGSHSRGRKYSSSLECTYTIKAVGGQEVFQQPLMACGVIAAGSPGAKVITGLHQTMRDLGLGF
ncbi:hypothetical protein L7F22_056432 [Adiantum nelumboides]|nr:hypothetical protein [Adiantum nelumboides]